MISGFSFLSEIAIWHERREFFSDCSRAQPVNPALTCAANSPASRSHQVTNNGLPHRLERTRHLQLESNGRLRPAPAMAHDDYHGQAQPYNYNAPAQYPDPRDYLAAPYHPELTRARSRSNATRPTYESLPSPQSQPIHDAVTNVFDQQRGAAARVPADIVKQLSEEIKAEVLNQLKTSGLLSPGQQTSFAPPPPLQNYPPQPQSHLPHSPTSTDPTKSVPPRTVHTPPSPARRSSNESSLPDHTFHDHHHAPVDGTREDLAGRYGDRSEELPLRRTDTNKAARDRSAEDSDSSRRRPPPVSRTLTDEEETVVEKMWQPLFADGKPTARLGQFLRGLALHLVSTFHHVPL